tara:strand:- start:30776 stop:31798 length:1023 start_codon:yes stop_codon:yes gene_type:complete
MNIEEEWEHFCNNSQLNNEMTLDASHTLDIDKVPKCTDIYISTKTKIIYLSNEVDLKANFWKIPIIDYNSPVEGVIKKQMKYCFTSKEELEETEELLKKEKMKQIQSLNKKKSVNKFKDIRKISIGVCKKDIISVRGKLKSAFYNCFVLILRIHINDSFKEAHVKIFNTGKLEIPGIQTDEFLDKILYTLLTVLTKICNLDIKIKMDTCETVLINSNFNCGYYINRDKLFDKLKYKYRIHTSYDPCSYPGIMSKFWYNEGEDVQTGIKTSVNATQISFMIFRTGSVLIVGKCDEYILMSIYEFLKVLFITEYNEISQKGEIIVQEKKKKRRKKYLKIIKS